MSIHWKDLVAEKRARQATTIPKDWIITVPSRDVLNMTDIPQTCGLLFPTEVEITNTDVDTLLAKLASSEWSSVEVTTAFYKRAIIAHQLVNCLTEIYVDRALARAAELDAHLAATGKVVGPLHGLPISLKDQLPQVGLETTMGYVSWIGKYAERNAVLVDILLELGAVPFVQTNAPQTLMWAETFNKIFGRTVNPYNRTLTCGGSSGGEGALIALKGSPLGIGSDIGGSIRIPAAMCGTYGLRPSYGRLPYAGGVNSMEGQDSILSVLGPLSNSLVGLKTLVKAVASAKPWLKDPLARRKKWDEEEYALVEHNGGKELCFAILWNDGHVVPHPPITRALEMTKTALLAAGHKVIDWRPLRHREMSLTMYGIWATGANDDYLAVTKLTGEPLLNSMDPAHEDDETSEPLDNFLYKPESGTAYQLWQLQKKRLTLREDYTSHWNATINETGTGRPVDAIIAPVAPFAAPPHGLYNNANYTSVWNGLDYPACVIPVTQVDPALDVPQPRSEFMSDADKENCELYKPETFKNAPVGLQIVGRGQEEEAVLAMSEIVDAALKAANANGAKL